MLTERIIRSHLQLEFNIQLVVTVLLFYRLGESIGVIDLVSTQSN